MQTQTKQEIASQKEVQKRYQQELHLYQKQIEKTKKLKLARKIA